jgi:hypothetical protein
MHHSFNILVLNIFPHVSAFQNAIISDSDMNMLRWCPISWKSEKDGSCILWQTAYAVTCYMLLKNFSLYFLHIIIVWKYGTFGNVGFMRRCLGVILLYAKDWDIYIPEDDALALKHVLTYSMEQSPSWETNRFANSQEIPRVLWNPKVHNSIHKLLPPVSILSQLIPVHTPTSHFLKIRLNIVLPSTPGSPQWSLSLRVSYQNPVHTSPLPHTRYIFCPSHYSWFRQLHKRWNM